MSNALFRGKRRNLSDRLINHNRTRPGYSNRLHVQHTRFDVRRWEQAGEDPLFARWVDALVQGDEDVKQVPWPHASELLGDVLLLCLKTSPSYVALDHVDPSLHANRKILEVIGNLDKIEQVRGYTVGEFTQSLQAACGIAEVIAELLRSVGEAEAFTEQLQQALDDGEISEDDLDVLANIVEQHMDDHERDVNRKLSSLVRDLSSASQHAQSFGSTPDEITFTSDPNERRERMQMLRSQRMRTLADRIGRIHALMGGSRSRVVDKNGYDPIDVEVGDAIPHVLSSELVNFADGELTSEFYRRYSENSLLQWETVTIDSAGMGDMVIAVDRSGSMSGDPLSWSLAVAEIVRKDSVAQGRWVHAFAFDTKVSHAVTFDGAHDAHAATQFASMDSGGGTNLAAAIDHALDVIEHNQRDATADILLITDAQYTFNNEWVERFLQRESQARLYAVHIAEEDSVSDHTRAELARIADTLVGLDELTERSGSEIARSILDK